MFADPFALSITASAVVLSLAMTILFIKSHGKKKVLLDQNEKLLEIIRNKDQFFTVIAHDLRSPLGNMNQLLSILSADEINLQTSQKTFQRLKESTDSTLELLENLLNWARLHKGAINLNPQPLDAKTFLTNHVKVFLPQADSKSIKIHVDIPHTFTFRGDEETLGAVIRNLMSNALKFTPSQGLISLSAFEETADWVFTIKDNGVGIGKALLNRIEKSAAAHSLPGTEGESGTGLGLMLCYDFIQLNKGTLSLESSPDQGTTATLRIPRF